LCENLLLLLGHNPSALSNRKPLEQTSNLFIFYLFDTIALRNRNKESRKLPFFEKKQKKQKTFVKNQK
jgi:hypothetical protein